MGSGFAASQRPGMTKGLLDRRVLHFLEPRRDFLREPADALFRFGVGHRGGIGYFSDDGLIGIVFQAIKQLSDFRARTIKAGMAELVIPDEYARQLLNVEGKSFTPLAVN